MTGMLFVIIIFFLLVFIGVPITFVLGLTSLSYVIIHDQLQLLMNFPQRMISGINNFTLLAIPFFMLAGELMNSGGVTKRIIGFVRSIVGHLRGGLAYMNILVSALLSSIIGSANAVAAITSSSIVPEMKKDGYKNEYSSAVTAASAIMGPVIPPSIILILYGVVAGQSVANLFLAAVIPGIMLCIAFSIVVYFHSKNFEGEEKPRVPIKQILKKFIVVFPSLTIPIIIVGGIIGGFFTPTEAGAIACLIALGLGTLVYKELEWKKLPFLIYRAGLLTASILIIAATASLFGWILTIENIPQMIASVLLSISDQEWVILLIITIFLLILGLFLEGFSAILITVPIFLPIIDQLGVDPLHFGIIICLNLVIGLITPPVGIVLFIVSSITKVSTSSLMRAIVPYLVAAIIVLLLIVYIPALTTTLPQIFSN